MSVYHVKKTGNDTTGDGSNALPFLTIGRAVAAAVTPGDTVEVWGAGAIYTETVTSVAVGTAALPITIQGHATDFPIWRSPNGIASQTGAIYLLNQTVRYLRIKNFTFSGSRSTRTITILSRAYQTKDTAPDIDLIYGVEITDNIFFDNGNDGSTNGDQTRVIYPQGLGYGSTYTGPYVNLIARNLFQSNYGSDVWALDSSDCLYSDNVSIGVRGSMAAFATNHFQAQNIHLGSGSNRNLLQRNSASNYVAESYAAGKYVPCAYRMDAGAHHNIIQDSIAHDLDYAGAGSESQGIHPESGCNDNLIQRNVVYRIGRHGYRDGSISTGTTIRNQVINNTFYDCKDAGIILFNTRQITIKNNIVAASGDSAVCIAHKCLTTGNIGGGEGDPPIIHTFANNLYFKSGTTQLFVYDSTTADSTAQSPIANLTLAQWVAGFGANGSDTGSIVNDPQFFDAANADFRLLASSPAQGLLAGGADLGGLLNDIKNPLNRVKPLAVTPSIITQFNAL